MLGLGVIGCNTVGKLLPPNDRVLVCNLSYDKAYLRTLDALDSKKDWVLQGTDKEKGTISVHNNNYSRLDDSDLRSLTFLVKRIDRETTSVSIAPGSQKVYGGDQLLKLVEEYLNRKTVP